MTLTFMHTLTVPAINAALAQASTHMSSVQINGGTRCGKGVRGGTPITSWTWRNTLVTPHQRQTVLLLVGRRDHIFTYWALMTGITVLGRAISKLGRWWMPWDAMSQDMSEGTKTHITSRQVLSVLRHTLSQDISEGAEIHCLKTLSSCLATQCLAASKLH